jgi:hypothetical protein
VTEQRSDRIAEQALLYACLVSKTARQEARKHIVGSDFDHPSHEVLWNAMSQLDRHDKQVDAVTLLAAVGSDRAREVIPDIIAATAIPDSVAEYAQIVRGWAVRRKIDGAAMTARHDAFNPDTPVGTLAAKVASEFIAIRDGGAAATDDITAVTARELLEQQDDEPDWLIPGLLEKRDRLILTGEEGLGKSHMLRQIAVHIAAGLDPFHDKGRIPTGRALIVDCENTWSQVRRKLRPAIEFAAVRGAADTADRIVVDCTNRMDITRDRDLARVHQLLDAYQPDIVVIGPLYRLVPRALQTDDDTAPVLAALDTIRDRGAALLMEAHAGHALKAAACVTCVLAARAPSWGGLSSGSGCAPSPRGSPTSFPGVVSARSGTGRSGSDVRTGSGGCR